MKLPYGKAGDEHLSQDTRRLFALHVQMTMLQLEGARPWMPMREHGSDYSRYNVSSRLGHGVEI